MTTRALSFIVAAALSGLVFLAATAGALLGGGLDPCASIQATAFPAAPAGSSSGPSSPATAASVQTTPIAASHASGAAAGCGDSATVLTRAASWLTAWAGGPVPYLSSTDPSTWYRGYRRDCSGYASMALGLPAPGANTSALAAQSTPITKTDVRGGDLLINPGAGPAGHVVVFDRWTSPAMDSYLGYEQSGDGGTQHRVIPYPYFGGYPMTPYRHPAGRTVALVSGIATTAPTTP